MNERKARLIESGMKLFAEKGYHNTSVQEIVTDANISKGAFYTYFKSKEDFIASSFYYFHLTMSEKVIRVMKEDLAPRISLAKQITMVADYIEQHKNFIIMHLREDMSIGEDMEATFRQIRLKNYNWMSGNIKAIYGDDIKDYLMDSIIQMEGLMNGYFQWIVLDHIKVDKERIGSFLVERLNDIVVGMMNAGEDSIIISESIVNNESYIDEQERESKQVEIIYSLRHKIDQLKVTAKEKERLNKVVKTIEEQMQQGKKEESIMVQGLLVHFKEIEVLHPECEQIARLLGVELLK